MSRRYSSQIANDLTEYMNANNLTYQFNQDDGIIELNAATHAKISTVQFLILVHAWGYTSFGCVNLAAQEAVRDEVIEYFTFANYSAIIGCFEFNIATGKIRYKVTVDCDGCAPSMKVFSHVLIVTLQMYRKFEDHLLRILIGAETAAEAIAQIQAERKN